MRKLRIQSHKAIHVEMPILLRITRSEIVLGHLFAADRVDDGLRGGWRRNRKCANGRHRLGESLAQINTVSLDRLVFDVDRDSSLQGRLASQRIRIVARIGLRGQRFNLYLRVKGTQIDRAIITDESLHIDPIARLAHRGLPTFVVATLFGLSLRLLARAICCESSGWGLGRRQRSDHRWWRWSGCGVRLGPRSSGRRGLCAPS
ncbi:Uncharacterised protein [Mycobacteroides abscessus subsp. massiliense]|uniref:Uncharacterized protein n=1 Tax=Mycobacteroides abscessus subsp. massiliense TaxID=1962118 RepID=A0A1T8VPK4_9MYCO|nr:Uncharacterised protein [Mycobacteroides abscessus subsp. massiliense]